MGAEYEHSYLLLINLKVVIIICTTFCWNEFTCFKKYFLELYDRLIEAYTSEGKNICFIISFCYIKLQYNYKTSIQHWLVLYFLRMRHWVHDAFWFTVHQCNIECCFCAVFKVCAFCSLSYSTLICNKAPFSSSFYKWAI